MKSRTSLWLGFILTLPPLIFFSTVFSSLYGVDNTVVRSLLSFIAGFPDVVHYLVMVLAPVLALIFSTVAYRRSKRDRPITIAVIVLNAILLNFSILAGLR